MKYVSRKSCRRAALSSLGLWLLLLLLLLLHMKERSSSWSSSPKLQISDSITLQHVHCTGGNRSGSSIKCKYGSRSRSGSSLHHDRYFKNIFNFFLQLLKCKKMADWIFGRNNVLVWCQKDPFQIFFFQWSNALLKFLTFENAFLSTWIRIRIPKKESGSRRLLNADPIRSEALEKDNKTIF